MSNHIDAKEHFKIARELEKHHAIFERVWTLARIRFSKKVPTAGVVFNKKGDCVDFIVNEGFWEEQNFMQKCFVISHECLHIALNHGRRASELFKDPVKARISNFAQDLVINHALVNRYGFDRDKIDPHDAYCWVDKFFKPEENIREDENYEYYFNRLMKKYEDVKEEMEKAMEGSETVDDHDFMSQQGEESGEGQGSGQSEGDEKGEEDDSEPEKGEGDPDDLDPSDYDFVDFSDYSDNFDDAIDKLDEELTGEEKETLKNFVEENKQNPDYDPTGVSGPSGGGGGGEAGTTAGTGWTFANKTKVKKRKWESIVTDWAKKKMKETYKDMDQWVHKNRRFSSIDTGLLLPSEYEVPCRNKEADLIDVWFYQDTSGSCSGYTDRFFAIAESMPLDRFRMRMFCFDTKVYETTLESRKLYGFGGTYFHILENHIQQELSKDKSLTYPDAVFVVTDGFGTEIVPDKPQNWHWIITPGGSKNCIPKSCNFYNLSNYE